MADYSLLKALIIDRGFKSPRQFFEEHKEKINERTLYNVMNNKIKQLPNDFIDSICDALDVEPGDWIKRKTGD
ncbi:helix-turn-helix domain-containing protein [Tumebacillus flagellatus]|uniref:HTH cro/C1-type domain-containing protein n=1 Tax=Tumebacillus flagellatus TaxID=1157490 RepID=A0A074M4B4_9BACL|nr:helix-turn-helix transcriptional regulator [Tumebacillus flagellatus]KEO80847.1 hypothetical protein EL26_24070 [Tumebacillus flagellatus]